MARIAQCGNRIVERAIGQGVEYLMQRAGGIHTTTVGAARAPCLGEIPRTTPIPPRPDDTEH
ncbi:hypothetical protein GCM10025762_10650 [Haloechinothrix salitolerans]